MICPCCGNKPLSFATFLVTMNPFRVTCVNCGAALRAGPIAYVWIVAHIALGFALIQLHRRLMIDGVIASLTGFVMFLVAACGLLFITAYVIPWMFFRGTYRAAD